MVINSLSPASQLNETVDGGQLAPQHLLPLGVLHGVDTSDIIDGNHAVGCRGCKYQDIRLHTQRQKERKRDFIDINVYSIKRQSNIAYSEFVSSIIISKSRGTEDNIFSQILYL